AQEAEKKAEQEALEKQADLMDDDAFAAIYAEVMQSRGAAPAQVAPAPAPPPAHPERSRGAAPVNAIPAGWTAAPPAAVPPPAPRPPPQSPPVMQPVAQSAAPSAQPERSRGPAPIDASALLTPIQEEEELPLLEAELVEEEEETADTGLAQSQWAA